MTITRPADREPGEGVVDEVLGVVVERLLRLLDDQDRGVVEVGPGQRDPELLVGLEVVPERPDDRVVAVGQVLDEVVGVGQLGGLDDAGQGVDRVAQPDVDQHRVGEDQVGLEHRGDLGADRLEGRLAEVAAVDPHPARLRGRSAGGSGRPGPASSPPAGPRMRRPGPGGDLDRDVVEQDAAGPALERHVLQRDPLAAAARGTGRGRPGAARASARGTRRSPPAERFAWRIARRSRSHSVIG